MFLEHCNPYSYGQNGNTHLPEFYEYLTWSPFVVRCICLLLNFKLSSYQRGGENLKKKTIRFYKRVQHKWTAQGISHCNLYTVYTPYGYANVIAQPNQTAIVSQTVRKFGFIFVQCESLLYENIERTTEDNVLALGGVRPHSQHKNSHKNNIESKHVPSIIFDKP